MGRINTIWKPQEWKIIKEYKNKNLKNDIVYLMMIGEGEDYGYYEITEFISKDIYEKIINNNYVIKIYPYSNYPILIFNETYEIISLVNGMQININDLSCIQQEFIYNMKNPKNFKLKK